MRPTSDVWYLSGTTDDDLRGIGWHDGARLRWRVFAGPDAVRVQTLLISNLRYWSGREELVLARPVKPEKFSPTEPDHANWFFRLLEGSDLPSGGSITVRHILPPGRGSHNVTEGPVI